jgi:alpha-beta hydrolase superfamily lysophospholipase
MRSWIVRQVVRGLVILVIGIAIGLGIRTVLAQRGPPLEAWHSFVPDELSTEAIDHADWADYLEAENTLLATVREHVMLKPGSAEAGGLNRYAKGGLVDPKRFAQDWNRSYELEPAGPPKGAVVLLHGLTDSPYSLRHVARLYRDHGFVAVGIRMPGHGTVPAGLTRATWEDWTAATRLAVREARRRIGPGLPIHIVGFSNGGALAMMYALEALRDDRLPRVDRLVLVSPMIGITRFARFAGLAGLPAFLPAFASTAWLGILPEFNPFKYNSFPVNGARQSYRLTQELQSRIVAAERDGLIDRLPPILTFQSVLDFTVSTKAVITALYDRLPANGSELVLFDINRNAKLGPLFNASASTMIDRLVPPAPRRYAVTVVANGTADSDSVVARTTPAGETAATVTPLGLAYPPGVFSLSHVALPFPPWDPLYGIAPDSSEDFGIHLGNVAARGERGALIVHLDSLLRMSSNPFYAYVAERLSNLLDRPPAPSLRKDIVVPTPPASDVGAPTEDESGLDDSGDLDEVW